MKKLTIYILILIFGFVHSQERKEILYCNDSGDSIFKTDEIRERDIFYKLEPIENKVEEYIFRSWSGNSCVEIIQNKSELSGFIHFATQKFDKNKMHKKIFTQTYNLDQTVVSGLFSKIKSYSFIRRTHPSGEYPVVHIFLIKENLDVEVYTTDIPKFEDDLFSIIPMNFYLDKFEKEIPFKKFVDWDILKTGDNEFYQTKGNGL